MSQNRPVIIIKKKVGHGGHHGGAWKVAYADFVTAMMALFIVLWLLNSSKKIQEAVGGYFRDPSGTSKNAGTDISGASESFSLTKDDMPKLKEEIEQRIHRMNNFEKLKDQIEMTVTPEGLRIEMLETKSGTFFNLGSVGPNDNGKELLTLLAQELGKLPNHISIEGHTDAKPYVGHKEYSNWELSTDRANAARRLMQDDGLRGNQISQVRGYADQMLRKPYDPLDPSNRRISVIVQYLEKKPQDASLATVEGVQTSPSVPKASPPE
ncbi:MAG: flagellar motor protein MotB [Terriglobales bacterium]